MEYYNYITELPFSKKTLKYRELSTKEQLALGKTNLAIPNNKNNHYDFNNFVISVLKNCLENPNDLDDINIIDYVLFITKIRIISIGNVIELISENDDSDVKTVKTTIDLNLFLKNLYITSFKALEENTINYNNIEIKFAWPNINCIKFFQDLYITYDNHYKLFINSYQEFIEYIKIDDNKIVLKNFKNDEKLKILENLSVSIIRKIQEKVLKMISDLNEENIWGLNNFKNYKFNFYNLSFVDFIRLFFSYDIKSLYKELYFMSINGLSPNYVMNISPAERKIYMAIIEEKKKAESDRSSFDFDKINANSSKEVQDLALEFGDTPP